MPKQEQKEITPNNTGIPLQMKEKFESLSGFSFDDVKVHYNSGKPAQLQALAYTQGNQVYVGPGQDRHLGHELGHVVQQKQGRVAPTFKNNGLSFNTLKSLEHEADTMQFYPIPTEYSGSDMQPVIQGRFEFHNPHQAGEGIVSHHIIPDNILVDMDNKLDGNSKKEGRGYFLPSFGNLNIRKLDVGAIQTKRTLGGVTAVIELANIPRELQVNFSEMSVVTQDTLTFRLNGDDFTYRNFVAAYSKYRENANDSTLPRDFDLSNLAGAFTEWQGGNLFYGPVRAEPMPSSQFDLDAGLYVGKAHAEKLKKIYDEVNTLKKSNQLTKGHVLRLFKALSDITRDVIPSEYDATLFFMIINQTQLDILTKHVAPDRVPRLAVDKAVPMQEIKKTKDDYFKKEDKLYDSWIKYYETNIKHVISGPDIGPTALPTFTYLEMEMTVSYTIQGTDRTILLGFGCFHSDMKATREKRAIVAAVNGLLDMILR